MRAILRFLDVDDTIPVRVREANPTVHARSGQLHQLVHAVSVGRGSVSLALKAAIKSVTPQRLRRRVVRGFKQRVVFGEPPPPDERFMQELRRRFKPEVEALSEYLNRDLIKLWGYDRVS